MQDEWLTKDAPNGARSSAPADTSAAKRTIRQLIGWSQRVVYHRILDSHVSGTIYVPQSGGFLVAANHASHLDAGLVKMALGRRGPELFALAAQDYFFRTPLRRWFFSNYTNILPIDRGGNFRSSLRRAIKTVRGGSPLLVFPEGTRSQTGAMAGFKPAIASMALMARVPIVPMYLWGTHEAMPKGGILFPRARQIGATLGPAIPVAALEALTEGKARHEAYRLGAQAVELAVRSLRERNPLGPDVLLARVQAWAAQMQDEADGHGSLAKVSIA